MKMKKGLKKLLALTLALVMLIAIGVPSAANAEESLNIIDVVEVNGVQEAVIGEAATAATMTVPEGANYAVDEVYSGWYDWTNDEYPWMEEGVLFQNGHKYEVDVMVRPAEGYVFSETTILKINGEVVYDSEVNEVEQYISWNKQYSFMQQIDKIELSDVPTAEVGGQATTQGIVLPEDAKYEISSEISWYNYTTDEFLEEGDTFEKGYIYNLNLDIYAEEGYEFADEIVVIVNGETLTDEDYYAYEGYANIWREYSFTEKINKIEIRNVPTAEIGEEATTEGVTVPEDANYEIIYAGWYNETTYSELQPGDIFEEGKKYSFNVNVEPKIGYSFAEDAVLLIDGKEEYDESYVYDDWVEICVAYSFLEQINKIEILEELPEAKVGETATAGELEVPEDAKYTASYAWMIGNLNSNFEPLLDEVFAEGNAYMLAVTIEPAEGCEFTQDAVATVAGKSVDTVFITNNGDYYVIMETHDLGDNTIDKIEITAAEPKAGEKISVDNVKVPEDAKYEIMEVIWLDANTEREATGTFKEGKQYQLMVVVTTEAGVYFANDVKITLNGKEFAGAKFENGLAVMPFLAVCELGFDLTAKVENPDNNQNQGGQNNNQSAGGSDNKPGTTITPSPVTGDSSITWVWAVLMMAAVVAAFATVSYRKKRNE